MRGYNILMKSGLSQSVNANTKLLQTNGLKATPSRLAILSLFQSSSSPMSVTDILNKFQINTIDQVTIYRTINTFTGKGILRNVEMKHNHAHYELANSHHHHLICKQCGKVEDIGNCNFSLVKKQALDQTDFAQIDEHSFELFGVCRSCALKKKGKE